MGSQHPPFLSAQVAACDKSLAKTRRPPRALLAALAPLFLFLLAQGRQLYRVHSFNEPESTPDDTRRLGVVTFIGPHSYMLWGLYSIHNQLKKFKMTPVIELIAVVSETMNKQDKKLIRTWLGEDNIREIDTSFITEKVHETLSRHDLASQVFQKLEVFNMTDFDKLIVLDADILVRRNIMHWFQYPAPAATQYKGSIEWNSAAMVIEPSTALYNKLLEYLPRSREWTPRDDEEKDTWNSGRELQGFLSSFFTSNVTSHKMRTMPYVCSLQTADMNTRSTPNNYFWRHRNSEIDTARIADLKHNSPVMKATCEILREWLDSVSDAPRDQMPELPHHLKKKCKNALHASEP